MVSAVIRDALRPLLVSIVFIDSMHDFITDQSIDLIPTITEF